MRPLFADEEDEMIDETSADVIAERQACIEICARLANLVIALGVTGDAVKMADDIAEAIRERGMSMGISAALGAEVERLRAELAEAQTVKDSFTAPYDYALLLDENAAMREEIGELRDELAEAVKPDCTDCGHILVRANGNYGCMCHDPCFNGSRFYEACERAEPVRLYEKEGS